MKSSLLTEFAGSMGRAFVATGQIQRYSEFIRITSFANEHPVSVSQIRSQSQLGPVIKKPERLKKWQVFAVTEILDEIQLILNGVRLIL